MEPLCCFPEPTPLTPFISLTPRQIGTQNSLELLEDPKAEVVDEIAAKLGLRKVLRPSWGPGLCVGDTRWGGPRAGLNSELCKVRGRLACLETSLVFIGCY